MHITRVSSQPNWSPVSRSTGVITATEDVFFSCVVLYTAHNIIRTYMLRLLFMVLHLRQCIKPDSTKAADEVLKACHDMVNTLKNERELRSEKQTFRRRARTLY